MTESYTPYAHRVDQLLATVCEGREGAFNLLVSLVYADLRKSARRRLRREPVRALDPSDLVHEAYIRLVSQRDKCWENRAHFLAVAAQAMRRILVDQARARHRTKRGGAAFPISLDRVAYRLNAPMLTSSTKLALALSQLEIEQPRPSRVVELRVLGGLTVPETAEVLGISPATVKRDWAAALAYLTRELAPPRRPRAKRAKKYDAHGGGELSRRKTARIHNDRN